MKEIKLKQCVEIVREVTMFVPDDYDEEAAARDLKGMPINLRDASYAMPDNTRVRSNWSCVGQRGIKNVNGETIVD